GVEVDHVIVYLWVQRFTRCWPRPLGLAVTPRAEVEAILAAAVVTAEPVPGMDHSFVQNLRRGHYEFGVEVPANRRLATAFAVLSGLRRRATSRGSPSGRRPRAGRLRCSPLAGWAPSRWRPRRYQPKSDNSVISPWGR